MTDEPLTEEPVVEEGDDQQVADGTEVEPVSDDDLDTTPEPEPEPEDE